MLRSRHDFIRYGNCWEDADYLLAALRPEPGSRILSIASAGDNSLALLSSAPEVLVAADLNPAQLFLTELKAALFKHTEYEEMLVFLTKPGHRQWESYLSLRGHLQPEARNYWDKRRKELEGGLIFSGKFERYLGMFRKYVLPLIHKQQRVEDLFRCREEEERSSFYRDEWDNPRWRWLFRLFFSRFLLGRLGRDPEFLRHVELEVGNFIYERTAKYLSREQVQDNFYLRFMLLGDFGGSLPFYLRKENFQSIREHIGNLKLLRSYVHEVDGLAYTHCNLSNIFEYMSAGEFGKVSHALHERLKSGAKLAYWNLMVSRCLSGTFPEAYAGSTAPAGTDKCFFYSTFHLDRRI